MASPRRRGGNQRITAALPAGFWTPVPSPSRKTVARKAQKGPQGGHQSRAARDEAGGDEDASLADPIGDEPADQRHPGRAEIEGGLN
jgi:hypothetical protein